MSNTKGTSAISLPSGGGEQSGIGETFSPDLFTGTGNFSVPIAVPAGRNGLQPELTLGYSTGNGNSPFGLGWALGVPGVSRKTSKGIPRYSDSEDIFILSGAEDLVPVKYQQLTLDNDQIINATQYRPRTEGLFARIIHYKNQEKNYWEVHSKDGLISWYGNPDATHFHDDDSILSNPENKNAIYSWALHKTKDPMGNIIQYQYQKVAEKNAEHHYEQQYLKKILYADYFDGNEKKFLCEVNFEYEERADAFSTYRQGFETRTTLRCKKINTLTHSDETRVVKSYHFHYREELPLNGMSLLEKVLIEGYKEDETEAMPPLVFKYSDFDAAAPDRLSQVKGPLPVMALSQPDFEMVDLNGNGLPDLLQMNGVVSQYWTNMGKGEFSSPRRLKVAPGTALGNPGVQMLDMNGDGRSDLLVSDGMRAGYYPGSFNSVWSSDNFRPFSKAPSFSFADPEVQLIDLDGDGITDVLRNGAKFECFYNSPDKGFDRVSVTNKKFTDFSFADPRIRFADMTGDGLQDIVFVSAARVHYWPNLGYGRFGAQVNMKKAPRFGSDFIPELLFLTDVDGDGLADLVYVANGVVKVFANQSGNAFSEEKNIWATPQVWGAGSVRVIDLMGNGQPGILWSFGSGSGTPGKMFFLDFTQGNKPYLLQEMHNNMGSTTRVSYGSSIEHYLRDQKNPTTRWQTQLPFPVQVVNKVEVIDHLSKSKLTTTYNYHNGYWDGAEREFRGFARVDTFDSENFTAYNTSSLPLGGAGGETNSGATDFQQVPPDEYVAPTETRSWFYPGPLGDSFSRWQEPDFSDEYWQGSPSMLRRSQGFSQLLSSLPRRARRDALRTLRGTNIRTEVYGLDKSSTRADKPYSVSETQMDARLVFDPADLPQSQWAKSQQAYWAGAGYVFFPFLSGQRDSQYERGSDPLHRFNYTADYDDYGQAQKQIEIAVPRGANPMAGGNGNYLATLSQSEYIYQDQNDLPYMVDRQKKAISYDATRSASGLSVEACKEAILQGSGNLEVIACSLIYYDGDAFEGLPLGEIGDYGMAVRSESLVINDEIITEAYGSNTPECFKTVPDWSAYPALFQSSLQNGDEHLGYKYHDTDIVGWYAEGERVKYDWQDISIQNPVGLVVASKDVFDNLATIEYDHYHLLPIKTIDPLGLETTAEYDYRTFQPRKVTDPNDNISVFDFSPLGLLKATALIGKGTEGDYKAASGTFYEKYAPSIKMEYDFFAFIDHEQPIWVKTIQREQHYQQEADSPTITKVEYSDGFGRLLQTRAQAEDVIFGNETFGSSGLSPNQNGGNSPAVGVEREETDPLNVVVSGWKRYNNKGEVVEEYEPFFDKGFEFTPPSSDTLAPQQGVKIKMYYDPLGRLVKTKNPDGSEQRVIFGIPQALNKIAEYEITPTPWETYMYDANDLAPLTNPTNNVPTSHYYTPKSELKDAMGRTIQTTEHEAQPTADPNEYEDVVMKYHYDIRGNLLEVRDPYNRKVSEHIYDFANQALKSTHIDSGTSRGIFDVTGKPIEGSDAKDARTLASYDQLQRPLYGWSKNNNTDTLRLTAYAIYGENATNPKDKNILGQLWQQYDESGKIESVAFDFKGNLLSKKQQVISSTTLKTALDNYDTYLVDWTSLPNILGTQIFETSSEFDALNRATKITLPENVENDRKEIVPTYNRAGALEKVHYDGTQYVENIAYNAKGQRLLIAFGNQIMTRYVYDNRTFRLQRQKSEKYTSSQVGDTLTYTPNSGNKKQDNAFNYDLIGNILKILNRVTDCGISSGLQGSDALDRVFTYDPLYRLTSATGRESDTQEQNDYLYSNAPIPGSPNANNVRAYERKYNYDKLGNILKMQQLGTGNSFTRNFNYASSNNKLADVKTGSDALIQDFSYDAAGNQLTAGNNRHYHWNAANMMICYKNQTGSSNPTIFAQYDYAGQNRVSKMIRTGTDVSPIYERTIYIDGIFEYHILENGSTYEKNYIHVMDDTSRIAMVRIGDAFPDDILESITYNLEDQIGSSTVRLSSNGSVIDKQEYYPFGDSSLRTFTKKRYQYTGKEKDAESGLYYYGARYYAAWTCRFISVDPLAGKYAHLSSYNYASNNPVTHLDVDGMQNPAEGESSQGGNENTSSEGTDTGSTQVNGIKATQEGADIYLRGFDKTLGDINPFSYDQEKGSIVYDSDKLETAKNIATCEQLEIIDSTALLIDNGKSTINIVDWDETLSHREKTNEKSLKEAGRAGETLSHMEDGKFKSADIYIARDSQVPTGGLDYIGAKYDKYGNIISFDKTVNVMRSLSPDEISIAALHELGHPYLRITRPELNSKDPMSKESIEHNRLVESFEDRVRAIYQTGTKEMSTRVKGFGKIRYSVPTYMGGKSLPH